VPTDPYVPEELVDEPRQRPNLAPGVSLPATGHWVADRPGDLRLGQPRGALLGSPGPNVGYALTLTSRVRDRFELEPGEKISDACAVVAAIAMKRAATFGRAPVIVDVEFAMDLMGYTGEAPEDVKRWRPEVVREAAHSYGVCRAVVDTVSTGLLRLKPSELPEHLAAVREAMERAAAAAEADESGEGTENVVYADEDAAGH
jgi:hypothetical protein